MSITKKTNYQVPGLEKGIRLIELLSESPHALGLSEISQALDLNKHMVFRILQTLVRSEWVIQEGELPKYRLTLVPFYYASKPVQRSSILKAATEPMEKLWHQTGESTSLGIIDDNRMLFISHLNCVHDVAVIGKIGCKYYLHCSAAGKTLLAFSSKTFQDRILSEPLEQLTINTLTSPVKLALELKNIKENGYAIDREEYANGVICFAAPIRDYSGNVVAALNTSVLSMNYTVPEFEQVIGLKILETCKMISKSLGYVE